jgi:hypothetical protein
VKTRWRRSSIKDESEGKEEYLEVFTGSSSSNSTNVCGKSIIMGYMTW